MFVDFITAFFRLAITTILITNCFAYNETFLDLAEGSSNRAIRSFKLYYLIIYQILFYLHASIAYFIVVLNF